MYLHKLVKPLLRKVKRTIELKSKLFKITVIASFFLLILVISQAVGDKSSSNKIDSPLTYEFVKTEVDPLCEVEYVNRSEYKVDEEELTMEQVNSYKKITVNGIDYIIPENSQEVYNEGISYSPKLNKVAFIKRERALDNSFTDLVYIKDLATDLEELIFTMKQVPVESRGEYIKRITGVGFSKDSTQLAITTGESLMLYNLTTRQIEKIFEEPHDPKGFGIFAYSIPFGWPISNKILLNEGYYEGIGAAIYDLNNKSLKSLNYSMYGFGEKILDVFNNNLVVSKVKSSEAQGENYISEIYLVNIDTLSEQLLSTYSGQISYGEVSESGKLYFIRHQEEESDTYYCYDGKPSSRRRIYTDSLIRYDIQTGEQTDLLKADPWPSTKGNYRNMQLTGFQLPKNGSNEILIHTYWKDVPMKYLLNENNPNVLIQINKTPHKSTSTFDGLDSTELFNLVNEQRVINGTEQLLQNNSVCKVAINNLALIKEIGRLPTDEERQKVDTSEELDHVESLVGVNITSESFAIFSFLQSSKNYFFTDEQYKFGCIKTDYDYVAFTVGY